jgi:hypothetical protein
MIRRRSCERIADTNSSRPVNVATVKKSIEARAETWLVRNVRHVWLGGRDRREQSRYGALGDLDSQLAEFAVNAGAPDSGLADAISAIKVRSS